MTQLLEWDAGDGPGRRAAQAKAVIDAGAEAFCEAEGDTLEEAYGDAIMKHLEAMMEARS